MKKLFKILPVILIIIVCSFVMIKVFADNKIEVKEYINTEYYSAVLYSNDELYVWGSYYCEQPTMKIIENVKDIISNTYYNTITIIDTEGNLKQIEVANIASSSFSGCTILETKILKNNVKTGTGTTLLTNDGNLYKYTIDLIYDGVYNETLIMNNVKEYSYNSSRDSYLILDNNNNLYAHGTNIYGKKINDGENITQEPIKIAENVKLFSNVADGNYETYGNFYITNDNELYIVSSLLPYPKLLKKNVTKYLYDAFYISEGKTYKINYTIKDDKIEITNDTLILNEELSSYNDYRWGSSEDRFYLTTKGNLYDYKFNKVYSNVKQLYSNSSETLIIKDDNTLVNIDYEEYYNNQNWKYEYIFKEEKKLNNVKEFINDYSLIMNDDTVYVKGNSEYYDIADFNGQSGSDYKNYVVIKGLPNVKETISLSQINLHHNGKTNLSVDETVDYYVDVYPFNAENKEIEWISSDESVAKISPKGTLTALKAGTTTIKVKSKTLDISDEVTITVYPKNTGIEILGEKEITIERYEEKMLTVKITPDNTLEQKIKWTSDETITFFGINEEYNRCYEDVCPKRYNEIAFEASKAGTYTITATTEDGLFSDSIKVHVTQGITDISINPDRNNYLGATLYIYMNESKTMDLKPKIYPEDATDKEIEYETSDPSIATVDEKGIVTAKQAGKVTITIKAKNNDVKSEFNILIFDKTVSTKFGDVDGDGIVDILDVVKLRKYVAGVEE